MESPFARQLPLRILLCGISLVSTNSARQYERSIINHIYEFNEDYNSYVPAATANDINLGECSPNFNMGFNLNIRYKRVSLSSTWSYQNGGKMYSGTLSVLNMFGATQETADARLNGGVEVSGVINTGTAEQPVYEEWTGIVDAEAYYTKLGDIAEAAVYDTSFLKLRDLTLNYDLPRIGNGSVKQVEYFVIYRFLSIHLWLLNACNSSFRTRNVAKHVGHYAEIQCKQCFYHATDIYFGVILASILAFCQSQFKVKDIAVCTVP